jgi:hypothetical protein
MTQKQKYILEIMRSVISREKVALEILKIATIVYGYELF